MNFLKITVLFVALARLALADVATHRKAASDLLDLVSGPETVRGGIVASAEPMFDAMRQQGAPDAMITEMKAALQDWMDKDFLWDELKPKMVDIYVREFSEAELVQVLEFYKTPTGAKILTRLPVLFAEGVKLGQDYAQTKQASLDARIMKIVAKYTTGAGAPQAVAPSPAPAPQSAPATAPASEKK